MTTTREDFTVLFVLIKYSIKGEPPAQGVYMRVENQLFNAERACRSHGGTLTQRHKTTLIATNTKGQHVFDHDTTSLCKLLLTGVWPKQPTPKEKQQAKVPVHPETGVVANESTSSIATENDPSLQTVHLNKSTEPGVANHALYVWTEDCVTITNRIRDAIYFRMSNMRVCLPANELENILSELREPLAEAILNQASESKDVLRYKGFQRAFDVFRQAGKEKGYLTRADYDSQFN